MIDDERKLRSEMDRAAKVEALFRDPIFTESFDILLAHYQHQWAESNAADAAERERLYALTQALGAVRGHLQSVFETGRMAEIQITKLAEASLH